MFSDLVALLLSLDSSVFKKKCCYLVHVHLKPEGKFLIFWHQDPEARQGLGRVRFLCVCVPVIGPYLETFLFLILSISVQAGEVTYCFLLLYCIIVFTKCSPEWSALD